MKLASLAAGRDGRLVVVSRRLERAATAEAIAPTLQIALDQWDTLEPELAALSRALDSGRVEGFPFDAADCASPLPRAFQWADGSAYASHVELLRRSRGKPLPDWFAREPLLYQGGSDGFNGPRDPIRADEAWGVDFEAEIAIVTDDVPLGIGPGAAARHIKLYMLANDVSLRRLIPGELEKGFGFFVGKPATTFSPVAVTPDELAGSLVAYTLRHPLEIDLNGTPFGRARPDVDWSFTFPDLIAHAARTRTLSAGTVIGGGTVSNRHGDSPGLPIAEGGAGYSCIAELRAVEKLRHGHPRTRFLRYGDRVRIDMHTDDGATIFGAIDQVLEPVL